MEPLLLTSSRGLRDWLSQHCYFEEGYCLSARPAAEDCSTGPPEAVVIEPAFQCGGGHWAGEVRVMRVFRCTGHDVREWVPGLDPDPYMDEGVKVMEAEVGLGLDLGRHGRLVCGTLVVERLP